MSKNVLISINLGRHSSFNRGYFEVFNKVTNGSQKFVLTNISRLNSISEKEIKFANGQKMAILIKITSDVILNFPTLHHFHHAAAA